MLTCSWNERQISALDLRNKYGERNSGVIENYRRASQKGELICEDCGNPVNLRNGDKKIAHFSHKRGIERECNSSGETEEHRLVKQFLYFHLNETFEDAQVKHDYRHPNKKRSDIFIQFKDGKKLAIEFHRRHLNIPQREEKDAYYEEAGINVLWILSQQQSSDEMTRDYFMKYSPFGYLVLIDMDNEMFILQKKIEVKDREGEIFASSIYEEHHALSELKISEKGEVISSFLLNYEQEKLNRFKQYEFVMSHHLNEEKLELKEEPEKVAFKNESAIQQPKRITPRNKLKNNCNNSGNNDKNLSYLSQLMATTNQKLGHHVKKNERLYAMQETAVKCMKYNDDGSFTDWTGLVWHVCVKSGHLTLIEDGFFVDDQQKQFICNRCR